MKGGDMEDRTWAERVSDWVARMGGSWGFILSFTIVLIVWVLLNSLAFFNVIAWDPYPYILLNLFLSCLAAVQAPFIMMSQNRSRQRTDESHEALFLEIKALVRHGHDMEAEMQADLAAILRELTAFSCRGRSVGPRSDD